MLVCLPFFIRNLLRLQFLKLNLLRIDNEI
ncbi:3-ketoacyl-ACP reductase [Campylobacter jejuni]|nr:3-ketoacyl-ACP reductase [Campylobacter jejuni]EAK0248699.1 3-ketoacyl-ACP reductase [Campylobacter jejuni]EAL0242296.1 3-ketoacyl-ACP reductase [Campylobacter jejuni]EAL1764246.1 3-ketoacyl-ACP reductase [Campylobacter jejuni]EAL1800822.1 3-ketoacyl-ACP reductase [Campylobacter jejuni]